MKTLATRGRSFSFLRRCSSSLANQQPCASLVRSRRPLAFDAVACGSPRQDYRSCSTIFATNSATASTCYRCYNSGSSRKSSGADKHRLFQEQLAELNEEREALFGTTADDQDPDDKNKNIVDGIRVKAEQITNQQMVSSYDYDEGTCDDDDSSTNKMHQILKDERQQLYGFTQQEELAWSNAGGATHKHHASFLQEIEHARRQMDEQLVTQQEQKLQFIQDQHQDQITPQQEYVNNGNQLTHVSHDGAVHMVDVGHKVATRRTATAETVIVFPDQVLDAFLQQPSNSNTSNTSNELVGPKGPIFATAKIAGILAAKQTSNLIPLCHPLPLEQVEISIAWRSRNSVAIQCQCRVTHKTGVEMEALMGASVAALTVYDMVKAVSHDVVLQQTRLLHKDGGKRHVDKR